MASTILSRFAQQDQLAAETVQQDFANKMAIIQAQRQALTFEAEQAELEAGKQERAGERRFRLAQAKQDQERSRIQMGLDALNLMARNKEMEMARAGQGTEELARLRLEMDQIEFMGSSFKARVDEIQTQIPKDILTSPMAQIGVLGIEGFRAEMDKGGKPGEAALRILEGRQATELAKAKAAFRESPAFTEWRKTLSPTGALLADQLVGSVPNPIEGDKGDPTGFSAAVVGLADGVTTDGRNAMVALAGELGKQWVAEGRFPTQQDAEEFLYDLVEKGIAPDQWRANVPEAGTVKRDIRRQPPEAFTPSGRLTRGAPGAPQQPLAIPPVVMKRGR